MLESHDVFPLKMFTYEVKSKEALTQLVNEINFKRPRMVEVSEKNEEQSVDQYVTDFTDPIELDNLDYVMQELNQELTKHSLKFEKNQHWTALYKKGAMHQTHNHLLYSIDTDNYSGILYLSNEGSTSFYSPTPQSWQTKLSVNSSYGTIVLFPNTLVHHVNVNLKNETERCVVAFNGKLSFV